MNTHIYEKEADCCCCCCCCEIPDQVAGRMSGSLVDRDVSRYLAVSLGIFSVVRIVRPAQYLIQATEYCVPDKECVESCDDDPCAMFRRMAFPVGEFCPPGMPHGHLHTGDNDRNRCGC